MKFPCELIAEPYIAQLRITAAKELRKLGFSQIAISELLQISQPVISGYLKKESTYPKEIRPIIEKAEDIGKQIANLLKDEGVTATEKAIYLGCNTCKLLRQPGPICTLHKEYTKNLSNSCSSCLTKPALIQLQQNKQFILIELKDFYNSLLKFQHLSTIIPEIGLQIVFSSTDPETIYDIAAFPSRIIKRKGRVPIADPPLFGSSNTTSGLLLQLRKKHQSIRSLITLKTSQRLTERIDSTSMTYIKTSNFDKKTHDVLKNVEIKSLPFAIIDSGSLGYEAITYVCAKDLDQLMEEVIGNILD